MTFILCGVPVVNLHDNANLVSFPALPGDGNVPLEDIFQDVSENILAVAGASSAAIYEDGWSGTLADEGLSDLLGYWVIMSGDDVLSVNGTPMDPETNYSLDIGDNLISYPHGYNSALLDVLSEEANGSLVAIFGEGISAYNYDGAGYWIGSLQYFTPNSGYWFLSNDALLKNKIKLISISLTISFIPFPPILLELIKMFSTVSHLFFPLARGIVQ